MSLRSWRCPEDQAWTIGNTIEVRVLTPGGWTGGRGGAKRLLPRVGWDGEDVVGEGTANTPPAPSS